MNVENKTCVLGKFNIKGGFRMYADVDALIRPIPADKELELHPTKQKLFQLWEEYGKINYNNWYKLSFFKEIKKTLEGMFVPVGNGGSVLDAGCGPGTMFESILNKMWPRTLVGADISNTMLRKAEKTARELISPHLKVFDIKKIDLTETLPWEDDEFDAIVSNIVIYYLTDPGWSHAVREFCRVTKHGGHIYVSTLLEGCDQTALIKENKWKLETLFGSPFGFINLLWALRHKKYPAMINECAKEAGVRYPSREGLLSLLKKSGVDEIVTRDIFWGAGIAVKAKMSKIATNYRLR
ncbi:MAG: class I SAM-dependent methyltransferase [bacterium]